MITRSQMRRQLRAQGGIMSVAPREKFGIGSTFQKYKDKALDKVRDIIPNELADVAVKAAPLVAMIPGYGPLAGGIMRGLGRFDQRGDIMDALKQGVLTFGGGKLFDQALVSGGLRSADAKGLGDFFNQGTRDKAGSFFRDRRAPTSVKDKPGMLGDTGGSMNEMSGALNTGTEATKGLMETATDKVFGKLPFEDKIPQIVKEKLLVGGISGVGTYLYEKFLGEEPPQQEGETYEQYMARRKENVGRKMRMYMDNYLANDPEYMKLDDAGRDAFVARYNVRDGGRIGYQTGGITMANTLQQNIAANRAQAAGIQNLLNKARASAGLPTVQAPAQTTTVAPTQTTTAAPAPSITKSTSAPTQTTAPAQTAAPTLQQITSAMITPPSIPLPGTGGFTVNTPTGPAIFSSSGNFGPQGIMIDGKIYYSEEEAIKDLGIERYNQLMADGGRVGFEEGGTNFMKWLKANYGLEVKDLDMNLYSRLSREFNDENPDPEETGRKKNAGGGIMSMPMGDMRKNKAGIMERDYRDKGGFVPVGIKERADDVPAMLSKNEFVFTADAVRGAGNGSIEKGAQRMYDTMKNLERRVT